MKLIKENLSDIYGVSSRKTGADIHFQYSLKKLLTKKVSSLIC